MTSEEKQEIINAVLAALRTNSKSIDQLTSVSEMSDTDFLELNGGRKVSYGVLFANHMSNDDAQEAWEYLDTHKVDKDSRGLVEVHQAPVIYLDAMGNLDGHSLNGSEGLEYRTDTKLIYDFPGGLFGAPKAGAVYISKNNFKKFVWNGTDLEELKVDECPLFVDYSEPVAFATLPVGGSYYVPSSHKIAVKIDASSTKTYDPLTDALYFFRDMGKVYTWNSSTNKWVPVSSDINVVNDCTTGGEGDALSAEMGKKIRQNVTILLSRLGEYAFPNGKPTLDWSGGGGGGSDDPVVPTYEVQKTIGTGLSASGGDSDVAEGDSLEVTIGITNNLYIIDEDNVEVTMDGSPVQGAFDASTGKITIAEVYGVVVINVPSMTYALPSNLAFHLDCKNRGGQAGHWIDRIGNIDFTLGSSVVASDSGVVFDGSLNSYGETDSLLSVALATATVEAVVEGASGQYNPILVNPTGNANSTVGLVICTPSNETKRAIMNLAYAGYSEPTVNTAAPTGDVNNFALSMNAQRYINKGVSIATSIKYTFVMNAAHTKLTIGKARRPDHSNDLAFVGTIKAIRVYNAVLTEQQQLQNWKVDKKRFNIS